MKSQREKKKVKGTKVAITHVSWEENYAEFKDTDSWVIYNADTEWEPTLREYSRELSEAYDLLGPVTEIFVSARIKKRNLEAMRTDENSDYVDELIRFHEEEGLKWELVGVLYKAENSHQIMEGHSCYYNYRLDSAPPELQMIINETKDVRTAREVFEEMIDTHKARPLSFVKETSEDGLRANSFVVSENNPMPSKLEEMLDKHTLDFIREMDEKLEEDDDQ